LENSYERLFEKDGGITDLNKQFDLMGSVQEKIADLSAKSE
jgi:hypothetical protein